MFLKKLFVFGLLAAVLPAVAEEAADRKTATSLKYVTHELDTLQNKFGVDTNKAMEYTNAAGTVQKRAVTSDLGTSTSDTSLPMVGGVNTKLNQKQDDIDPVNDHTAVTYTGQPGGIGRKGIYQTTGTYTEQKNDLIDAKTFNAALKKGLDNEFRCSDNRDPVSGLCWLYTIHNTYEESAEPYVSATGTATQDGTPTPTNPIYPKFFQQGDMILRRVGDYADSYDATTHKITRRVGVKVIDGTEDWRNNSYNMGDSLFDFNLSNSGSLACSHYNKASSVWYAIGNGEFKARQVANQVYFRDDRFTTKADFKSWLAEQYAAGTPVTVYYPLETPVQEDWTATTYNENVYIPQNQ